MKYFVGLLMLFFLNMSFCASAQKVHFELTTSPSILFDFNTIHKYETGITVLNAITLNLYVEAAAPRFDLYVGAETAVAGEWDVNTTYSNNGLTPTVDMVKVRFRNANSTSQVAGYFDLQDIATPTYIIGTAASDVLVNCPAVGTNAPGKYDTSPGCYKFRVDLKIKPGFTFQSGSYILQIDYVIVEDL